MSFLRRLLGGGSGDASGGPGSTTRVDADEADAGAEPTAPDADEHARDLELLRAEAARQDPLVQRQQRYAQFAWTPPPQGGPRRADHESGGDGEPGKR